MPLLDRLWLEDDGQDVAEYALMMVALLLLVAGTITTFGNNIVNVFGNVIGQLTAR